MRIKETAFTVFALGVSVMTGAAGYHQIYLANQHHIRIEKNYTQDAVFISTDDTTKTLNQLQVEVPDDVRVICAKYGAEYGIEPELLEAIAWRESRFCADVVSENGMCKGLMQINDSIHRERMKKLEVTDIYDVDGNIHVAADYLAELLKDNSSIEYALARYHGEARPERVLNGATPSNYVRQIIKVKNALKSLRKEA